MKRLMKFEGGVGDLAPAAVDGQRVPAVLDLDDLGHAFVVLLLLVGGVGDRPGHGVVLLPGDDQQRATLRVLGVDLRLGPRVEVRGRGLEQRLPRRRHCIGLVQFLGLVLADRVGEGVAELLIGQWHRAVAVGRVAQHREARLQRRDRKWQDAAEWCRVDCHRRRGQTPAGQDLRQQPAERVADDGRLLVQPPDDLLEVAGHLADRLAGEHLRMRLGLLDRVRIVWPSWGQGDEAVLLEYRHPAVPAAGQQPQPMNEHHRRSAGRVGRFALLELMLGDRHLRRRRVGSGGRHGRSASLWHHDSPRGNTALSAYVWTVDLVSGLFGALGAPTVRPSTATSSRA